MTSLANNIKKFRKLSNLTQHQLALLLNVTATSISAWEVGRNKPLIHNIEAMAKIFNIKKSDLIEDDKAFEDILDIYTKLDNIRKNKVMTYAYNQLKEQNNPAELLYDISLYGYASAGTGQTLLDETIDTVQINFAPPKHDIALVVIGNSMAPLFKNGDYIFIDKSAEFYSGIIGVVLVNNETYLKKIYKEDYQIRLVSLNKDYKDIIVNDYDSFQFIGKVIL